MTAGDFILAVNPTDEELTPDIAGKFKVYADGEHASGKALRTANSLRCAAYSILFVRKIK